MKVRITDDFIKSLCSDMIYKRGCEYFSEGRVHLKKRSDTELSAVVDGEGAFNVYIKMRDGKVASELCTCAYYETMKSPCKHIVAVLKERQTELDEGMCIPNENDRIAEALCYEFSLHGERSRLRAAFMIYMTPNKNGDARFEIAMSIPDKCGEVEGLENFLDSYLNYKDFKLDRTCVYNRRTMYFSEHEDAIIKIMAEVFQTRSTGVDEYFKASHRISFGSAVMRRILPHLSFVEFKLVYDGYVINGARISKEDPDILIDVEAYGKDIVMSISESGFAITPNGEWFFYNDTIYNTTHGWRDYFMPIYRSLLDGNRTQITFKNDNALMFATHVLPKLKSRHGVVIRGFDEFVVNKEAEFSVTLDSSNGIITAIPSVRYGNIAFRLPTEKTDKTGKIIIRDKAREEEFLSLFSEFEPSGNSYSLCGDSNIYKFLTNTLKTIALTATVNMTDRFKSINIRDDFDLNVNASYNSAVDYLEIGFESEFSNEELSEMLKAMNSRAEFYRLRDGSFVDLKKNRKFSLMEFLRTVGVTDEELLSGKKALSKIELLRVEATKGIKKDESVLEYLDHVRSIEGKVPDDLKGELREYQKDSITWFSQLSELGMGGILADDMGLGKTLQTIAYIHGKKPRKPTLIVAPGTLVYNWKREIERFIPNAKFLVISGNKEVRRELIKEINDYEFVITSYALLRRDIGQYKEISFSYCIIDEAQYIKNAKTMNAVSVKKISADNRFALTGTPIENSIMELWSIFDFIMPGYLGTARNFRERFEGVADDSEISASLRNIIRPFLLRRLKKDVLDELPEKIETTMIAELTKEQKLIYQAYAAEARKQAEGILYNGNKMTLLTFILRLRQICAHPILFEKLPDSSTSGKLELLKELVSDAKEGGHRVLVFSQFRRMLSLMEEVFREEGYSVMTIHGDVPLEERVNICERFNSGEGDIILVSLKAGGTGINLTGADTVIHYDPWWNPAVTDQATDRAYRIGQTRAVQVIKLVSHGTIEEKILKLENEKRGLAEDIIRANGETLGSLTNDEIMSLFEF